MFQITKTQMRLLNQNARDEGNRRIANYVETRFPQVFEGYDEERKIIVIERMRSAAAMFGLERDDHIGAYIDLFLMYGSGFESQPWAAPILRDTHICPEVKISMLKRRIRASGVDI